MCLPVSANYLALSVGGVLLQEHHLLAKEDRPEHNSCRLRTCGWRDPPNSQGTQNLSPVFFYYYRLAVPHHVNLDEDPSVHVYADPVLTFHFSPCSSSKWLRSLVNILSNAQFWASTPPLWASNALHGCICTAACKTSEVWMRIGIRIFSLKGHIFWGFLKKLVPHRSLTLPFEPFRFWLRIRGDIRVIEKWLPDSASRGVGDSPTRWVGESAFECLKEKLGDPESQRLPDSANGESLLNLYSNFFTFFIKLQHFKRLNQHFKGPT